MPKDGHGTELAVGDLVTFTAQVTTVLDGESGSNVVVKLCDVGGTKEFCREMGVNSRLMQKVEPSGPPADGPAEPLTDHGVGAIPRSAGKGGKHGKPNL